MLVGGWERVAAAGWATILMSAIGYAQVCGLTCSLGSCVELAKHDESGECSGHKEPTPESPAPSDSDCIQHGHPNSFVRPASQSLSAVDLFGIAFISLPVSMAKEMSAVPVRWLVDRDHSPPIASVHDPLYITLASLRI